MLDMNNGALVKEELRQRLGEFGLSPVGPGRNPVGRFGPARPARGETASETARTASFLPDEVFGDSSSMCRSFASVCRSFEARRNGSTLR